MNPLKNLIGIGILFAAAAASAVQLDWDRNPETNIVGYRIYVGQSSRYYDSVIDVGNVTSARVDKTAPGRYYYAVTAYNSDGLESDFSEEVSSAVLAVPVLTLASNAVYWTAVANAQFYHVTWRTPNSQSNTFIVESTVTTLSATNFPHNSTVTVRAQESNGFLGPISNSVLISRPGAPRRIRLSMTLETNSAKAGSWESLTNMVSFVDVKEGAQLFRSRIDYGLEN